MTSLGTQVLIVQINADGTIDYQYSKGIKKAAKTVPLADPTNDE